MSAIVPAWSQSTDKVDWRGGLKLIDSSSAADTVAAIKLLETAIEQPGSPPAAHVALALCLTRDHQTSAASQVIDRLSLESHTRDYGKLARCGAANSVGLGTGKR